MFGNFAEVLNEENNGVLIEIKTALEDLVDLSNWYVLNDQVTVGFPILFSHCFVSSWFFRSPILRRCVSFKIVTIAHLTLAKIDHLLKFWNTVKDEVPTFSKIVTLECGQLKDLFNDKNVFVFDSLLATDLREFSKRGNEGVSFILHIEVTTDLDRVGKSFDT